MSDAGSTPRSSSSGPKKEKDDTSQKSKLEIANQNFNSYYGASTVDDSGLYGRDGGGRGEGRGEGEAGGEGRERIGEGDGRQFMDYPVEYSQHYSINTTRQCSATSTRRGQGQGQRQGENNYSGRYNDSGSDGKINFSGCNIDGNYDECGYRSNRSSTAASSHRYDEGEGEVEEKQDEAVKAIGGRQGVSLKVLGKGNGSSIAWSSATASITTSSPSSPSSPSRVRAPPMNDSMVENKRNQQLLPQFKLHAPQSPTHIGAGTHTGIHTGTCLPAMLKERRRKSLTSHSTILHPRQPTKPATSHTTSPSISHRPSLPASRTTHTIHTTLPTVSARKSVSEKSYSKPQKLLTRLHSSNSDHDYGCNNDNNDSNYNENSNNNNNGSYSNNNNDNNNNNDMNDIKNININGHKMNPGQHTQGHGYSDETISNVINAQTIEKNRQLCPVRRLPTSTVKNTNINGKYRDVCESSKGEKRFPNIMNVSKINMSNNVEDRKKLFDVIDLKEREKERESEREKERGGGGGTESTLKMKTNANINKDMHVVSVRSNDREGNKEEEVEEEEEGEGEGYASNSLYLDEWFRANPLKPSNTNNNDNHDNDIDNNNCNKNKNNSTNVNDNRSSSSSAMTNADLLDNNGSHQEHVHTFGQGTGLEKDRNQVQMRGSDTVEKLEKIVLARFGFVTDENDEICIRRMDGEGEGDKSYYDDDGYDDNYDHNNYDDDNEDVNEDENESVPDDEDYRRMQEN